MTHTIAAYRSAAPFMTRVASAAQRLCSNGVSSNFDRANPCSPASASTVLDYSVLQRPREIGIRMAIGAPAADIARRVTAEVFSMVLLGALAGLAVGMASARDTSSLCSTR